MSGQAKTIARNSAYMFAGNVFKKAVSFVITILVARYLGVEDYGKLSFAIGFVALFTIFTDFGAQTLINREIARNKEKVNRYVSNTILLKIGLSAVLFIILKAAMAILSYERQTQNLVYLAAGVQVIQSLGNPFGAAFRGYEKLQYSAITISMQIVFKLLLALIIIGTGKGIKELLIAYIFAEVLGFVSNFTFYHTKIRRFGFEWDWNFAKEIFRKSIPFGVAALFMVLYDKIDITMLSKMVQNPDMVIGGYSAAYNLLWAFEFIPISIGAAVYPYASKAYLHAKEKFKKVFEKLFAYYFYLTIPLGVGTTILATDIMRMLYGEEYLFASLALQILIWSVLFKFQMYTFGIVLNSMNKEVSTMKATMISLGTNVALNLVLIPKYSFIGASIATVAAEAVYFVYAFIVVRKSLVRISILKTIGKPTIGSAIMAAAVIMTKELNLFLCIGIGITAYAASMFLMKAFVKEDIETIKSAIRKT